MNLTQEQEAALYVQYTPLIYKTVHHFCRLRGIRLEYFEDLFQEASVAFIRHLRRITSTEDIVRFRTPVKRAMATFMEQAFRYISLITASTASSGTSPSFPSMKTSSAGSWF